MFGLIALTLASAPVFTVSYPPTLLGGFSGKIYLYVTKASGAEGRLLSDWDQMGPVVVATVKGVKADTDIPIDLSDATASLDSLPPGDYSAQAVIERGNANSTVGDADGNLYSVPVSFKIGSDSGPIKLVCDQIVTAPTVHVGKNIKIVDIESVPLTNAQRRSYVWQAAVVLPDEWYSQPSGKFPIVIDIPDMGKSYSDYPNRDTNKAAYVDGKPVIYLRLDTDSPSGYHLFANGSNNGPWATAFVHEFLPYVAKEYHGDTGKVSLRGTGAGGWSALSLLASNPDAFQHADVTSPSSVDFHQFHGLNLYTDENVYTDNGGLPRKWERNGNQTWKQHADLEKVLKGLQIAAWEADFSPRGKNNKPLPLFDRATGRIDPAVAKSWLVFDLDAYLKDNWATLGPKISGKVTIVQYGERSSFDNDSLNMLKAEANSLGARFNFSSGLSSRN